MNATMSSRSEMLDPDVLHVKEVGPDHHVIYFGSARDSALYCDTEYLISLHYALHRYVGELGNFSLVEVAETFGTLTTTPLNVGEIAHGKPKP
jgi:hypothetical protein